MAVPMPFVSERTSGRLVFRLHAASGRDRFAIVAEEQFVPDAAAAHALKLTRRQVEVLLEVEKAKSNEEIAAALFISPLTVRTHLDHIFDMLDVNNRTAAVARLRGLA